MNLKTFRRNVTDFGAVNAFADVVLRIVNRVLILRILKAIRIEQIDPSFLSCEPPYEGLFLSEEMLRNFAADPHNEMSSDFLEQALAKGDECYGFIAGAELAAYGWYSRQPTDVDLPGCSLRFDARDVYMYKGFTATRHRGKRLHAVGMTRALQSYLSRGFRGIVSYVEWDNFASLKSCYRMGYRDFGRIAVIGIRSHCLVLHDRGCKCARFRIEKKRRPKPPKFAPALT